MKKNTKGFTLIELLIVVVIIGILAAIAIPKFASTKQNAYMAAMKTDLRNLATAEEGYASNHAGAYIPTQANVTQAAPVKDGTSIIFQPSTGVTLQVTNTAPGWSATATHAQVADKTCAIFYNTTKVDPAANEGEPACN
jgi:prepilin-type N-terminal cleavage/methylation domain-containing protein